MLTELSKAVLNAIEQTCKENENISLLNFVLKLLYQILLTVIVFLDSQTDKAYEPLLNFLRETATEFADYDKYALVPIQKKYKMQKLEETEIVHREAHTVESCDYERKCKNQSHAQQEAQIRELRAEVHQLSDENKGIKKELRKTQQELVETRHENTNLKLKNNSRYSNYSSKYDRPENSLTYRDEKDIEAEAVTSDENEAGPGGKIGHKGHSGYVLDNIESDEVIKCYPKGMSQEEIDRYKWTEGEKHKRIDIRSELYITEYVQMTTRTEGKRGLRLLKGSFPPEAQSKTTYGVNIMRLIMIYHSIGLISMKRISEILRDNYGITISESTVKNIISRVSQEFKQVSSLVAEHLWLKAGKSGTILKADETSLKVGKERWYDHVITGAGMVLHNINHTRSLEGTFDSGVLKGFKGILISDFYHNYLNRTWTNAFCWSHLKREIESARVRDPDSRFAQLMKEFSTRSYLAYKEAKEGDGIIPQETLDSLVKEYWEAIEIGKEEQSHLCKETRNLIKRMEKNAYGILLHLFDTEVARTTNEVEKQCRQIKKKLDVSNFFKTASGAQDYASLLTVIETAKKQGLNPIEAIDQTIGGNLNYLFTHEKDSSLSFSAPRKMGTIYKKIKS